jgi:hypothetical protein
VFPAQVSAFDAPRLGFFFAAKRVQQARSAAKKVANADVGDV